MTDHIVRFLPRCAPAALAAILLCATPAVAQEAPPPQEVEAGDADIERLLEMLTGSYSAGEYTLRIAEVVSPPFERPLYVELVRHGFEDEPERQQLWWIHRRGDELSVRVNIFPKRGEGMFATNLADLAVGMWAAPEFFPRLQSDHYDALGDMRVEFTDGGARMWTEHPFPIAFGGAYSAEADLRVTADAFVWEEQGRDASGELIWGAQPIEMDRLGSTRQSELLPSGIRVIDLRVGVGEPVMEGYKVAVHYKGWLTTGIVIDDSRAEGRKILTSSFPVNAFAAFNEGLRGMMAPENPKNHPPHSGGLRRLLVPSSMAFGPQGAPPIIPPDANIIFQLDLQSVLTEPLGNVDN